MRWTSIGRVVLKGGGNLCAAAFVAACGASGASDPATNDDTLSTGGGTSSPGTIASCATGSMVARRVPVYMLVVLDASGSMVSNSKWDSVTSAMGAFLDAATTRADPGLAVGLTVFSDSADKTQGYGPYPNIDVPIGFVDAQHADALMTRISRVQPVYETPMAAVMTGQYPRLEAFTPASPLSPDGKKVLVLMTDGVPYPNAAEQRPVVIASAGSENAKKVATFVVGIGSASPYDPESYDPRFLAQVAIAGGTAHDGCDPEELVDTKRMCHLQITTPDDKTSAELVQEFYDAIDGVRSAVASCVLTLEQNGDLDPRNVNVVYDDPKGQQTLLLMDAVDGWTWDDPAHPEKIELHGRSCKELESHPDAVVRVVVGCRTVIK